MPELHIYDVIRRPVITEKATALSDELNQYVFEVARKANKLQVKEAVEVIFEVNVTKVRTMVQPAKRGRRGRAGALRTKEWKKAIVTLAPGDQIDLFNA